MFWGTKWDAYDTKLDDKKRLTFDTAWSLPEPILTTLSWLFPEITIHIETIDEGWNFFGTGSMKEGKWVIKDIRTLAKGVKGKDDSLLCRLSKELKDYDLTAEEEE